jgi:hypothetical protein
MWTGSVRKPAVQFSFASHDFGPTFISEEGVLPATAVLKVTNRDSQELSVDLG